MNIKLEYEFGDWRDWFLLERKGFIIKSHFIPFKLTFNSDDKPVYIIKYKFPLNTKKLFIVCSCDGKETMPDDFFLVPLDKSVDLLITPCARRKLTFKKVEDLEGTFYSAHPIDVSGKAFEEYAKHDFIKKFRFQKGVIGYSAK